MTNVGQFYILYGCPILSDSNCKKQFLEHLQDGLSVFVLLETICIADMSFGYESKNYRTTNYCYVDMLQRVSVAQQNLLEPCSHFWSVWIAYHLLYCYYQQS